MNQVVLIATATALFTILGFWGMRHLVATSPEQFVQEAPPSQALREFDLVDVDTQLVVGDMRLSTVETTSVLELRASLPQPIADTEYVATATLAGDEVDLGVLGSPDGIDYFLVYEQSGSLEITDLQIKLRSTTSPDITPLTIAQQRPANSQP